MRSGPKISPLAARRPASFTNPSERSLAANAAHRAGTTGKAELRRHSRHRGSAPSQVALLLQPQPAPDPRFFWWPMRMFRCTFVHFVVCRCTMRFQRSKPAVEVVRGPPLSPEPSASNGSQDIETGCSGRILGDSRLPPARPAPSWPPAPQRRSHWRRRPPAQASPGKATSIASYWPVHRPAPTVAARWLRRSPAPGRPLQRASRHPLPAAAG